MLPNFFFEKMQYQKKFNWAKLWKNLFFDIYVIICNKLLKKLLHKIFLKKLKGKKITNFWAKMCLCRIKAILNFPINYFFELNLPLVSYFTIKKLFAV